MASSLVQLHVEVLHNSVVWIILDGVMGFIKDEQTDIPAEIDIALSSRVSPVETLRRSRFTHVPKCIKQNHGC